MHRGLQHSINRLIIHCSIFLDAYDANANAADAHVDFSIACRALRVSTKYFMPRIRQRSVKQSERYLPSCFAEYDNPELECGV